MRLDPRAFGSKVAFRVFASFVIAAVIPVIATVLLVQSQVRTTLTSEAQSRLDESSRALGTALLDRLILANEALISAVLSTQIHDSATFQSVQLLSDDTATVAMGESFSLEGFENVQSLGPQPTLVVRNESGNPSVFLATRIDAGIAIGQIRPSYLWDSAITLPYSTELCVFDLQARLFLHCSDAINAEARDVILNAIDSSSPSIIWSDQDEDFMASQRQLFLPSRFAAVQPWSIVVSQPMSIAMEPLAAFDRLFPQVIAICLIVILLLSAVQIRRIMLPLRQLVAGTKRVAEQHFSTRLDTSDRNEFSELGESFNEMTERLGRQFETITAFAEIDRLILSSHTLDQVMERVLKRVITLTPDYCVSVLIFDPNQADRGQLYSQLPGKDLESTVARISIAKEVRTWMASIAAGNIVDPDWIRNRVDSLPTLSVAKSAVVVPVFRGDVLRGALIAQLPERGAIPEREYARILELTGRLAVAISAADHESELFNRAHFDALTGLPNRQLCFDRLYQAVAQARREEHKLAVLFIDLDDFKDINDTFGHAFGDELIREVALRLGTSIRETDTVARLGGDEYVVLLPHIHGMLEVQATAEKILEVVSRPYRIHDQECSIGASIGAAIFPDDAANATELLRKADTAMYAAKDSDESGITFFEDEMDRIVKERFEMQQDLRSAFASEDFQLVYQPQLDIESGELICMEALLRWHHPTLGMISPSTFVPVLEGMGLISEVGSWVIEKACSDYAAWIKQGLQLPRIAINLSSHQITGGDLEDVITDVMKKTGLQGKNVEVELTEHSLIKNFDVANSVLNNLRKLGVRVSIDDFGTGYSSLGYLQDLQFDVLKIDRCFVKGLPQEKPMVIVAAILGVANALGKEVVAEGIETETHRSTLVELGCRIGQGDVLSVPMAAEDVIEWSRHLDVTSVIQKLIALDEQRIAS